MSADTDLEHEVKTFIISTLKLEDVQPQDISTDDQLFGAGLGLDSVDALELGVALSKRYGIKIDSKSPQSRAHLTSVRTLSALIHNHRAVAIES
jgi:acyl carrier protein